MKEKILSFFTFTAFLFCMSVFCISTTLSAKEIDLYYWQPQEIGKTNFGDYLSFKLIERMTLGQIKSIGQNPFMGRQKFLAVGSILHFACENDVIWGSGINGKHLDIQDYHFSNLDVRAVRGPLTRKFLMENFGVQCPEIYGDPALLFPYFFPEFKKSQNPLYEYIVIPHSSEEPLFPKDQQHVVVYPTDPWDEIIQKILNSKFVISSSLHGIVLAEAFGIPAKMLRVTENEPLFKYQDYYLGTGRPNFQFATSVEEALRMGGEAPMQCNLQKLYSAFPFEFLEN